MDLLRALLSDTFDTKYALSALYLWLLFGFLSSFVACDVQRWAATHDGFRHVAGVVAFFLLFTVIDTGNNTHVGLVWLKTLLVYAVFVLMTKSKWYFAVPVLALLVVDQTLAVHERWLAKRGRDVLAVQRWRGRISGVLAALVIVGFVAYAVRQRREFGAAFTWHRLLLTHKCAASQG